MNKSVCAMALSLLVASTGAQAAFKEFSLSGHTATTYNERGYTLGVEMVKRSGEKIFYANLVLPEGSEFENKEISSTFSFDSGPTVSLKDLSTEVGVGKTEHAVSWEVSRLPDSVREVPKDSDLYEFMRRYHLKFNYIDGDGRAKSTQIGLRDSSVNLAELIKR